MRFLKNRKSFIVVIVFIDINMTTIQISEELRDALKVRGQKGETYESIIQRLIEDSERLEKGDKRGRIKKRRK